MCDSGCDTDGIGRGIWKGGIGFYSYQIKKGRKDDMCRRKNTIWINREKLIIGMLCMLCMMMLLPLKADAAASYKKLYKKFLSQSKVKAGKYLTKPEWYYVLNVDKKGVPELVITSCPGGTTSYDVYTVSQNKVKYLGTYTARGISSVDPTITYSSKYKGFIAEGWTNGIGGVWSNMYVVKNQKLKRKYHAMSYYPIPAGSVIPSDKEQYEIGTSYKKTSKKKFTSYCNKYFKSRKTYKMKKNTKSNRKKSFG